jgi:hypothetical protein
MPELLIILKLFTAGVNMLKVQVFNCLISENKETVSLNLFEVWAVSGRYNLKPTCHRVWLCMRHFESRSWNIKFVWSEFRTGFWPQRKHTRCSICHSGHEVWNTERVYPGIVGSKLIPTFDMLRIKHRISLEKLSFRFLSSSFPSCSFFLSSFIFIPLFLRLFFSKFVLLSCLSPPSISRD